MARQPQDPAPSTDKTADERDTIRDIAKLLVHPGARGQGAGVALMTAAEAQARAMGLSLLVLDTAGAAAERIYRRMGWIEVGNIPDYALNVAGTPEATTIFYKRV